MYVNDVEITTFTSPGDFGGRRGKYTPEYWPVTSTQFGVFKKFTVNYEGVFVDNVFIHNHVVIDQLKIFNGSAVKLTIGIKENARAPRRHQSFRKKLRRLSSGHSDDGKMILAFYVCISAL